MSEKSSNSNVADMLMDSWMKYAAGIWEQSIKNLTDLQESNERSGRGSPKLRAVPKSGKHEQPEDAWRELILQMARNSFSGYLKLQKDLFQKSESMETLFNPQLFESIAGRLYTSTLEGFEKELRQYLQIPPLGLTRAYQEKVSQVLSKYGDLKKSMTKFMQVFSRPFETSLAAYKTMAAEVNAAEKDPKEYYQAWIKQLEAEYMNLYKTPQYLDAMSRALSAYEDFAQARNAVFEDMLKFLPIPTNTDMDELYKEIYQLKKRLKEYEKHFNSQRHAS